MEVLQLQVTGHQMWRLNKVRHKAGRQGGSSEELRLKRRENERALRQARRDRQLVSKRLLLNEDEEQPEVSMDTAPGQHNVVSLLYKLQHNRPEKDAHLKALSKVLRDPSSQLIFIKHENSMHLLVGLLTGSDTQCRLQAVRCLHELSHSPHTNVAPACLPATPYLLTYLSGPSTKFTAAVCRCSQPLSGFSGRCQEDEIMLQVVMKSNPGSDYIYVVDTRPKLNAMANRAAGKGYENEDHYTNIKLQFIGIENIHVMRSSQQKIITWVICLVSDRDP